LKLQAVSKNTHFVVVFKEMATYEVVFWGEKQTPGAGKIVTLFLFFLLRGGDPQSSKCVWSSSVVTIAASKDTPPIPP